MRAVTSFHFSEGCVVKIRSRGWAKSVTMTTLCVATTWQYLSKHQWKEQTCLDVCGFHIQKQLSLKLTVWKRRGQINKFNFNKLHCPVFIIILCLWCSRFLFVFTVRKQKYPETTYRWYFAVIQFKLWTTWRRILATFNGKLFSSNVDFTLHTLHTLHLVQCMQCRFMCGVFLLS